MTWVSGACCLRTRCPSQCWPSRRRKPRKRTAAANPSPTYSTKGRNEMENAAATELFAKAEDIRKAAKPEDRMTPARAYREAMRQNPELAAAALRPGETVPVRKAELEVRLGQHAIEIRKASAEELSASQA